MFLYIEDGISVLMRLP
uniref:Uncharacterized protein n=1 Tax=Arundo donax TaxID=35708 RepID=A0A0A9ABB4_ARUDO